MYCVEYDLNGKHYIIDVLASCKSEAHDIAVPLGAKNVSIECIFLSVLNWNLKN